MCRIAYIAVAASAVLAWTGCNPVQQSGLRETTNEHQPAFADSLLRSLIELDRSIVGIGDSDSHALGSVSSATIRIRDSTLFVVDNRLNTIAAYSIVGQRILTIGRPGSGPGEFREPGSLVIQTDSSLELFDPALRRITRFALQRGSARVDTTMTIESPGHSMCAMDSHYFTFGLSGATIVQEFDAFGRPVKRFGRPFGGTDAMLQQTHSFGLITCVPTQHLLVVVPHNLPVVRAYSAHSGVLVWESPLHGYEPIVVRRLPRRNAIEYAFDERRRGHYALSAVVLSASAIAIQYGLIAADSHGPSDLRGVATEFVRLEDGQLLGKTMTLPWIMYAAPPLVVTASDDPYPRLAVAHFRFTAARK